MAKNIDVNGTSTNEEWPRVIALPKVERPWREPVDEPARVAHAEDLPDRMYMGRCDRESFRKTGNGWSASYRASVEGTGSEIEYDAESGSLVMKLSYRGHLAIVGNSRPKVFVDSVRGMLWRLPERWADIFEREVCSRINVQLPPISDRGSILCSYPDGAPYTIYCPVPVSGLDDALACIEGMAGDPRIVSPVFAEIWMARSVVSFFEGRNHPPVDDPRAADIAALHDLGVPVGEPAAWETVPPGVRALSVHRRHYALMVDAYFHDLEPVLSALAGAGVIGLAPEDTAVVVPYFMNRLPCRAQLFDAEGTRGIAAWLPRDLETMKALLSRPYDPAETMEKMSRAMRLSSKAFEMVRV